MRAAVVLQPIRVDDAVIVRIVDAIDGETLDETPGYPSIDEALADAPNHVAPHEWIDGVEEVIER